MHMKLYMQNSFKNKVVIKSDILMVSILVHFLSHQGYSPGCGVSLSLLPFIKPTPGGTWFWRHCTKAALPESGVFPTGHAETDIDLYIIFYT